jgi:uncharacterized protein YbjT (DUF2867 family)
VLLEHVVDDAAGLPAWRHERVTRAREALECDPPSQRRERRISADSAELDGAKLARAPDPRRSLAAAATESRIPHVVFLSGFAAHRDSGSGPLAGLHDAERLLGAVPGLRLSSIRAGYFYENVLPVLNVVKDAGLLPSFFPAELPVPMVATRDIGLLAAELLLDATSRGVVELGAGLRYAEIARVLGELLGKPVRVEEVALDAIAPTIADFGFNADLTNAYVELITGIRSGALAFEGGHRRVAPRTSLEDVFRPRIAG